MNRIKIGVSFFSRKTDNAYKNKAVSSVSAYLPQDTNRSQLADHMIIMAASRRRVADDGRQTLGKIRRNVTRGTVEKLFEEDSFVLELIDVSITPV